LILAIDMNYWWVNHKKTVRQERAGNYIWSPHINRDGSFNQTYLNLSLMQIGDIVFSYANGEIGALGRVIAAPVNSPKPIEFGAAGAAWDDLGYLVRVDFLTLSSPLRPKSYIEKFVLLLPPKYSPIRVNGDGNQKCYLAQISRALSNQLLDLIGLEGTTLLEAIGTDEDQIIRGSVKGSRPVTITQKQQLIQSRRGQGAFRRNVFLVEKACRVTGVADLRLLRASHIKPWSVSNNDERLDGNNGFLLAPHIDHLFDRGFISFSDFGEILISKDIEIEALEKWGVVEGMDVGKFNERQSIYLHFHRNYIFRQ